MSKIAIVVASSETVSSFLLAYIHALANIHDVHVVSSLGGEKSIRGLHEKITIHDIKIHRNPHITADLSSLIRLYKFFKTEKFDVVHSFTPKAGLLSQISAYFAKVDKRFHTFTGQVWATKQGFSRLFLKTLDKITASLATFCLVDSPSQQAFLIAEKLLTEQNSQVLLQGSVSGINIEKFAFSQVIREQLRVSHNIDEDTFVFLFVGRLKVDKGIPELVEAFTQLKTKQLAKLVIIGSDEENLSRLFEEHTNIEYLGFRANVSDYYSFADALCLPSHREGFGNVIIEAAACQLPSIASDIYGLSDAVAHNHSGLLHEVKNAAAITQAMEHFLSSPEVLAQMRTDARQRVENTFDENLLVAEFLNFYQRFGIEHNQEGTINHAI